MPPSTSPARRRRRCTARRWWPPAVARAARAPWAPRVRARAPAASRSSTTCSRTIAPSVSSPPPTSRSGSRSGGYGGSRVDIFDDVPASPASSLAASPAAREAAAAALSEAEPLHELEDIIRVRGYDPKAIDEYFLNHPAQLFERAADVTSALTTIWWLLRKKDYENLVPTIERLGPTYVKFGQALASRGDLVGAELAADSERLQDDMEAAPIELARAIVAQECPRVLGVLDDGKAIAAASLSQVYKGTVAGRAVAVKVQRPGIAARVAADARCCARRRRCSRPPPGAASRRRRSRRWTSSRRASSRRWTSRTRRRTSASSTRCTGRGARTEERCPRAGYVRVPGLIPSLPATRRVLVMEWLEGDSVISLVSPKAGEKAAFEAARRSEERLRGTTRTAS